MATGGVFTGSRGGNSLGPWLTLEWGRLSVDIPNNRSLIRLALKLNASNSLSFSANKTGVLHGSSFTYTGGFSGTGSRYLRTIDVWVNHNSDGSKQQTFSATFNIGITWGGSSVNSISVSGTADIDSIPRASSFAGFSLSNSVLDVGKATTINYSLGRKSSDFSHDMTLKYGNRVISSWNTGGTGAQYQSLTAAQVNTIIQNTTSTDKGTLTLTMQTKSGSTLIGSSESLTTQFTLDASIKPTASNLVVSVAGNGKDSILGLYMQNMSRVQASFQGTPGYGATMSINAIYIRRKSDKANTQIITGYSGTTPNPLSLPDTYEIIGTLKDSRGRTADVSTTIEVNKYAPPRISTFTTNRLSTVTSNVTANIKVIWDELLGFNPATIELTSVNNVGIKTSLYKVTDSIEGFHTTTRLLTSQSDSSSFTYTLRITDFFGNTASAITTVGTSFVEFTIAKGLGVGIGKVHERGALDVKGNAYIDGDNNIYGDNWVRGQSRTKNLKIDSIEDILTYSINHGITIGNDYQGKSLKISAESIGTFNTGGRSPLNLVPGGGEVTIGKNDTDGTFRFDSATGKLYKSKYILPNNFNELSLRDGTVNNSDSYMIQNLIISIPMNGAGSSNGSANFPVAFDRPPVWILTQVINASSLNYTAGVYSPTATGCTIHLSHIHNTPNSGSMQVQIVACGLKKSSYA